MFILLSYGKLEDFERFRSRSTAAAAAAAAAAADLEPAANAARPLVSAEKVESIEETVQKLLAGAGAMGRRQAALEDRCVCLCLVLQARIGRRTNECFSVLLEAARDENTQTWSYKRFRSSGVFMISNLVLLLCG